MDERELMKKIDEIVEHGGIVADVFSHFQETDQERLKQAAVAFATAVKSEKGVVYSLSEIAPPEKDSDFYTTYVETRIVVKNMMSNEQRQDLIKYVNEKMKGAEKLLKGDGDGSSKG